ncbi:hypothetical protein [Empedobacter sp.]|uniref:hypothetical protein n=1 Tax=Empedobacter sp. TaxID=1927715 RepID=UPI0028999E3D|nr:hypothetical protein [Empedobacter sp.]
MAFNWEISIANPVLDEGMSFRVRYKKQDGVWLDFLPNPITNTFTIPNLDEEKYIAEIKTVCPDGTLSTPGYIENFCFDENEGNPPNVDIFWNDSQNTEEREYENNFGYNIGINATDTDNDIVMIEGETSTDGNNWISIGVVSNNYLVSGNSPNDYFYRVKVTDSKNNTAFSNILSVRYKETINRVFEKYTKLRYSYETYTEPKFYKEGTQELIRIRQGFKIKIYIKFERKSGFVVQFNNEYEAQSNYNNLREWFESEVKDLGDWGRQHTYYGSNRMGLYGTGYGFNNDGSSFFVRSQREGTASHDLLTDVKIEIHN